MPAKKYGIIYADPPWSYADKTINGAAEKHYPTMKLPEILALPVKDLAADDAVLFMWATYPFLREALQVMDAWGFRYKTIAFQWVKFTPTGKEHFGLGRWTRGNTEPCLLATRGKPARINAAIRQIVRTEIFEAPRARHSEKPAEVRERIVELMGPLPRVELFAREKVRGWDVWGNEVSGGIVMPKPKPVALTDHEKRNIRAAIREAGRK